MFASPSAKPSLSLSACIGTATGGTREASRAEWEPEREAGTFLTEAGASSSSDMVDGAVATEAPHSARGVSLLPASPKEVERQTSKGKRR